MPIAASLLSPRGTELRRCCGGEEAALFHPAAASLTLSDARANLNVPLNGTERIE